MAWGRSNHIEPSRSAPRCAAKRLRASFGPAARAAIFSPEVAAHQFIADVARLVERLICNQEVAGSIPAVSPVGMAA